MCKYSADIVVTVAMMTGLSVALLWPLSQSGSLPGSKEVFHFLAFGVLVFPTALTKHISEVILFIFFCTYGGLIERFRPLLGIVPKLWTGSRIRPSWVPGS